MNNVDHARQELAKVSIHLTEIRKIMCGREYLKQTNNIFSLPSCLQIKEIHIISSTLNR